MFKQIDIIYIFTIPTTQILDLKSIDSHGIIISHSCNTMYNEE